MEALDKHMMLHVRGKDERWVLGSEYGKKLRKSVAC
jgi:hypothetical protein